MHLTATTVRIPPLAWRGPYGRRCPLRSVCSCSPIRRGSCGLLTRKGPRLGREEKAAAPPAARGHYGCRHPLSVWLAPRGPSSGRWPWPRRSTAPTCACGWARAASSAWATARKTPPGASSRRCARLACATRSFILEALDRVDAESAAPLLDVLDPARRSAFRDTCLAVPFDRSAVLVARVMGRTVRLADVTVPGRVPSNRQGQGEVVSEVGGGSRQGKRDHPGERAGEYR